MTLPHDVVMRVVLIGLASPRARDLQGVSRKKLVRIQNQERAAEDEANFLAGLFTSGMDDWEVVDIFNEP